VLVDIKKITEVIFIDIYINIQTNPWQKHWSQD